MSKVEIEQRTCVRFAIPGASISYRLNKLFASKKKFGEEFCPVADISRGGIRFRCKTNPKMNASITLTLTVPGEQIPLILRGKIRWVGKSDWDDYSTEIGVQFNPYGDENKEQNYPGVLVKLIALEQKYAEEPGEPE